MPVDSPVLPGPGMPQGGHPQAPWNQRQFPISHRGIWGWCVVEGGAYGFQAFGVVCPLPWQAKVG